MYANVIVGVDQETGGRDAIVLARLLMGVDGKLTLAHVHGPYGDARRGVRATLERRERAHAMSLLERASDSAGVQAELRVCRDLSVGHGLQRIAEEIGAELIVVAASHRGTLGRMICGDDAALTLSGAACAVAVAPPGYGVRAHRLRRVGVAVAKAADTNGALAETADADRALALARQLAAAGAEIVELDAPADVLTGESGLMDLLVIGAPGYGPVGRVMSSETIDELLHRALCPLLVIPRGPEFDVEARIARLGGLTALP